MTDLHPPCAQCKGPVVRRHREDIHRFAARKYCCQRCSQDGRKVFDSKPCSICGKGFTARPDEDRERFRRRRRCADCGAPCTKGGPPHRRSYIKGGPAELRPCQVCGEPIKYRTSLGAKRYAEQLFCSKSCHMKSRSAGVADEKTCLHCGIVMRRRGNEKPSNFATRQNCSVQCARRRNATRMRPVGRKDAHFRRYPAGDQRPPPPSDQPQGCATIEEFLAKGGVIRRIEPEWTPPIGGTPVFLKRTAWRGDGKVR